jgi:hypothetical protein
MSNGSQLLPDIGTKKVIISRSRISSKEGSRRSISNLYPTLQPKSGPVPGFMPMMGMNPNYKKEKLKEKEEEKAAAKHISNLNNENKRIRKQLRLLSQNLNEEISKHFEDKARSRPIQAGMPKTGY